MKPTRKQLPECDDSELAYLLQPQYQIRRIAASDYRDVLRIQRACFAKAMTVKQLITLLYEQDGFHVLVIERRESLQALESETVGYCIYRLNRTFVDVLSIAVLPEYRHNGIAKRLVNMVMSIAQDHRCYNRVTTMVKETNTEGQLFFKNLGFRCVNILKGILRDIEPRYYFVYQLKRKESSDARTQQAI